ncbi:hypothetical protein Gpo141_00002084 [Globisporangium polare]
MPLCAACFQTKGFNKFHSEQKKLHRPVCKECFRAGRTAIEVTSATPVIQTNTDGAKKPTSIADFELLSVIGQGAFGKVLLVRHSTTSKVHAMKIISKKFLIERESVHYMKTERDVMTKIRHPFVISLTYAFQSESKVYLVMDYQPGGELFSYLREEGTFTEDTVRFYLAEMILALEHLHSHGIIHRDLKPENVLISREGHVKLTDFGLAKEYQEGDELLTVCGTQEYMAPEMLLGKGYDSAVDWWSLGALAHEMLMGKPPFRSKNAKELHTKILTAKLQLPRWLSNDAHSLIKSLLERNVSKRLGGGKSSMFVVRGVSALKSHPFFKKIDWNEIEKMHVLPPMTPTVDHEADTRNFSDKFTKLPASDLACDDVVEEDNRLFLGFSFIGLEHLGDLPMRSRRSSSAASTPLDVVSEITASLAGVVV